MSARGTALKKALYSPQLADAPDLVYSIGSMPNASNQLTLSDASGGTFYRSATPALRVPFAVGNKVIVEIGGEASAGAFGTMGVGGVVAANPSDGYYWHSLDAPKALVATITGIAGSVLTLDATSFTATTNAKIYRDNSVEMTAELNASIPGSTVVWPRGKFAQSDFIFINPKLSLVGQGKGATKIFVPKGAKFSGIRIFADFAVVRDLTIIGNAKWQGFGIPDDGGLFFIGSGVWSSNVSNCLVQGVEVINVFQKAVWFDGGGNHQAIDCSMYQEEPLKTYLAQWYFGAADSFGPVSIRGCKFTGVQYLAPGFETFRSHGVTFLDCVSQNGSMSTNSSGNWRIENFKFTSTPNCWLNDASYNHTNAIVDVNSNIHPPDADIAAGGVIKNMSFVCGGDIGTPNHDYLIAIRISGGDTPNVLIDGGVFTYPLVDNTATAESAATAIYGAAFLPSFPMSENCVAQNMRVTGYGFNWFGNIHVDGVGAQVINCAAQYVYVNGVVTGSGNPIN